MPDFKIYQRIYPDPLLGGMLAEAYRGIILFAMKATTYSQAGGFGSYIVMHPTETIKHYFYSSYIIGSFAECFHL